MQKLTKQELEHRIKKYLKDQVEYFGLELNFDIPFADGTGRKFMVSNEAYREEMSTYLGSLGTEVKYCIFWSDFQAITIQMWADENNKYGREVQVIVVSNEDTPATTTLMMLAKMCLDYFFKDTEITVPLYDTVRQQ